MKQNHSTDLLDFSFDNIYSKSDPPTPAPQTPTTTFTEFPYKLWEIPTKMKYVGQIQLGERFVNRQDFRTFWKCVRFENFFEVLGNIFIS